MRSRESIHMGKEKKWGIRGMFTLLNLDHNGMLSCQGVVGGWGLLQRNEKIRGKDRDCEGRKL